MERLSNAFFGEDCGEVGELLGYPTCCRDAWVKRRFGWVDDPIRMVPSIKESESFSAYLNVWQMESARLIAHQPCSFDCKRSREYAKKLFEKLREVRPKVAEYVKKELNQPVLVHDFKKFIRFYRDGPKLEVERPDTFSYPGDWKPYAPDFSQRDLQLLGKIFVHKWEKEGARSGESFLGWWWISWDQTVC